MVLVQLADNSTAHRRQWLGIFPSTILVLSQDRIKFRDKQVDLQASFMQLKSFEERGTK